MHERETVKKYYTELLQIEFEGEIQNILKNEKSQNDKRIKDFLDKCQLTKYKSPNKPSIKNISVVNDENAPVSEQTSKGFPSVNQRIKSDNIGLKEINHTPVPKVGKANLNGFSNGQVVPTARAAATVKHIF
jgi:hypothetical protein